MVKYYPDQEFRSSATGENLKDTLIPTEKFEELSLTFQQKEVLLLAINGRSGKQIAQELGLKIPTVKSHLNSAFHQINQVIGTGSLHNSDTIAINLLFKNGFVVVNQQ